MLGAYASVAILCAASLVVGQAILSLCGRRQLTWLAGPVGLAAILVASAVAIKLPGHGTAVAVTLATLFAFSLATLVSRQRVLGADPTNVRSKDARTVLDKYLTDPNAGSTGKVGGGWRCPHPYNEEQGKCTNKKKSASFKYKNGYGGT